MGPHISKNLNNENLMEIDSSNDNKYFDYLI